MNCIYVIIDEIQMGNENAELGQFQYSIVSFFTKQRKFVSFFNEKKSLKKYIFMHSRYCLK